MDGYTGSGKIGNCAEPNEEQKKEKEKVGKVARMRRGYERQNEMELGENGKGEEKKS